MSLQFRYKYPMLRLMGNQPTISSSDTSPVDSRTVNPSPLQPQIKTNLMMPIFVTLLMSAVVFGFVGYYLGRQSSVTQTVAENIQNLPIPTSSPLLSSPTVSPAVSDSIADWETHTIKDASLTFSAPSEMTVRSETQKDSETGIPYSLNLYVEKDMGQPNYYQLYGVYQWDIKYTQDALNAYKENLEPASIKNITLSGFPALEGRVKGQRNRFVTYILTDKGMFSLFTAESTQMNKQITDQILATFKFTN